MMSLGDVAARLKLPVFPCLENKAPAVETGFKAASADPAVIKVLFDRPNVALIGVATGEVSGLVIIDIDVRDGRSGMDWLGLNADALPPTRTHKTRSGGLHLVFRYPTGYDIRNSASRLAPGVDVRGNGGFACWPPSPGYQIADPTEPAEMPLWLIKACCKPEPASRPVSVPVHINGRTEGGTPYALSALNSECRAIVAAPDGAKHDTLNKAAYSIGGLVSSGQVDESTARAALRDALEGIRSRCDDFAAAERTLKEAFEAGAARPRPAPVEGWRRPQAEYEEPPPDPAADEAYWASLEAEIAMTADQWREVEQRESGHTVPASPQAAAGKQLLWSIREAWDESTIPVRPWISRGYLMRSAVTVVSGPGSAGKSSLMVAWAVALVLGCPFARFKVLGGPLKVATYNVEDDADEQKRRFSAMAAQLGLKPEAFEGRLAILGPERVGTLLHMPREGGVLVNTPVMDRLAKFIEEFEPDVLMLDPFVELHAAEENDNTAVRAVMAAFRAMAVEREIAVVILHHARKGTATPGDPDSLRGASSIVGAARVALTLNVMTEDEAKMFNIGPDHRRDYFRLDGAKSNYAPIGEAEWFQRHERRLANGDQVAVAWPWNPPSLLKQAAIADIHRVLQVIDQGPGEGVLYAASRRGRGNERWVGRVITDMLGGTEEQAKEIVAKWLRSGLLFESEYEDPRNRHSQKGVRVDFSKQPDGHSTAGNIDE